MIFNRQSRRPAGSIVVLSTAGAFVLAIVVMGIIYLSLQMHGAQLVRNGVDAGTLNIAAHMPDIAVDPVTAYSDCANVDGQINMACMNRVYGKAMLINFNAESMAKSGQSGQAVGNALTATAQAQQQEQTLRLALTDRNTLRKLFRALDGKRNSAGGSDSSNQGAGAAAAASASGRSNGQIQASASNQPDLPSSGRKSDSDWSVDKFTEANSEPGATCFAAIDNKDADEKSSKWLQNFVKKPQPRAGTRKSNFNADLKKATDTLASANKYFRNALSKESETAELNKVSESGKSSPSRNPAPGLTVAVAQEQSGAAASSDKKEPGFSVVPRPQKQPEFSFAYDHRGDESNIKLDAEQLPAGVNLDSSSLTPDSFVAGYSGVRANGVSFAFIPFREGEISHLISTEEFNKNAVSPGSASTIPNTLQATGSSRIETMSSVASAIVNPRHNYDLSIPHAFFREQFPPVQLTWIINGKTVAETSYEWWDLGQVQNAVKDYVDGASKIDCFVNVASEYIINRGIVTCLQGDDAHEAALKMALQRTKEVDLNLTAGKLLGVTGNKAVRGVHEYIWFPKYATKDATEPQIKYGPIDTVSTPWMNKSAQPDGVESCIGTEYREYPPGKAYVKVKGSWKLQSAKVEVQGRVMWTPGTGFNQCLGTVSYQRHATVTFIGK